MVAFLCTLVQPGNPERQADAAESTAEREAVVVEDLISLDKRTAEFLIRSGEGAGKHVSVSLEPSKGSRDQWVLTFEGLYRMYLYRDADGAVRVPRMVLFNQDKEITFRPSVELIPAQILAGLQKRTTGKTSIFDLEKGEPARKGIFKHSIKGMSRMHFDSGTGGIEGWLIWYECEIDLEGAIISIHLESGWSRDKALVYWRTRYVVEKLWVFGDTTILELIIAEQE
jgi:hypothetical protein